jgi:hypothetical protein
LRVDFSAVSGRRYSKLATGDGTWSFGSGHLNIDHQSIEKFNGVDLIAVYTNEGVANRAIVRVYDVEGTFLHQFQAYPDGFCGGVKVAVGDLNCDGLPDLATSPGPSFNGILVKTWDVYTGGTVTQLSEFYAFPSSFNWGGTIAIGDVNFDGGNDIVVGADRISTLVKVFNGQTSDQITQFEAFSPNFLGGVWVAVADTDGDGRGEIVAGTGPTAPARIRVFDNFTLLREFTAFPDDPGFRGGVQVAAADVNGDGKDEIIASHGREGTGFNYVLNGLSGALSHKFRAYEPPADYAKVYAFAIESLKGGPDEDLITIQDSDGRNPELRRFDGATGSLLGAVVGSGLANSFVGVISADLNGDGRVDLVGQGADPSSSTLTLSTAGDPAIVDVDLPIPISAINVFGRNVDGIAGDEIVARLGDGSWRIAKFNSATNSFSVTTPTTWSTAVEWFNIDARDVTGDGRADLIGRTNGGEWWVGEQQADGSFINRKWTTWSTAVSWNDVKFADFNGDGRIDVAGRASNGQWWIARSTGSNFTNFHWGTWSTAVQWRDVNVGDVDGDGRADIVGRTHYGQWWLSRSTGSGFATSLFGQWNESVTWLDVKLADVNGDGRADLIGRVSEQGDWWAGISNGSIAQNVKVNHWSTAAAWRDVQVTDVDGDGRVEAVARNANSQWWAFELDPIFASSFQSRLLGVW